MEQRIASARRRDRDFVRRRRKLNHRRQRHFPAVGCSPGTVLCQSVGTGARQPPHRVVPNSAGAESAVADSAQGDRYGAGARGASRKDASGYFRAPQRSDRRSDRDVDRAVLDRLCAAIQKFEADHKLPVTGRLSDRLLSELATMTGRPIQ